MQEREEELRTGLENQVKSVMQNELKLGNIGVLHSADLDLNAFTSEEQPEGASVKTADLYQIAKAFITTVTA